MPNELIKEIAQELDSGMKCFYHIRTAELKSFPDSMHTEYFDDEVWRETIDEIDSALDEYILFEVMESQDSFKMMECFVNDIENKDIRGRFEDAITYKKPFQNFKQLLLGYPELREQWFKYKDQQNIEWVKEQLEAYNRSKNEPLDSE